MANIMEKGFSNEEWRPKPQHEGFRITPQRRTIMEALNNHQSEHLTAEEIYRIVRRQGAKLGVATVYRNLAKMEKMGLVIKIKAGSSPAKYEINSMHISPHYHLVCLSCGKVLEVDGTLPEDFRKAIARHQNFEIAHHPLVAFGYCEKCRLKQNNLKTLRRKNITSNKRVDIATRQ
ncbi:MAG: transcriptional repressor [Firmicutes bacterium]|nr:transcriptional repressor [Bacillota bacterium]